MALKIQGDIEVVFSQRLEKRPHGACSLPAFEYDDVINLRMEADQFGTFGLYQPCDAAFGPMGFDLGHQPQAAGDISQRSH